jgi:hypothetical protein
MLRNHEGIPRGETRIFDSDTAQMLISIGAAVELFEIKPVGPKEIKPIGPTEIKEEFSGKKKAPKQKS